MSIGKRVSLLGKSLQGLIEGAGEKVLKPTAKKIGSIGGSVLGELTGDGMDLINKLTKVDYQKLGKSGFKKGANIIGGSVNMILDTAEGATRFGSLLRRQLLGDAPISTNYLGPNHIVTKALRKTALFKRDDTSVLLGMKATKLGFGVLAAGSLVAGTGKAANTFMDMQRGRSDGMLYTNAPINTYATMGDSYAHNAGATGDLVFALHNQRRSGIY